MKVLKKFFGVFFLAATIFFSSCQTNETDPITDVTINQQTLAQNSDLTKLMQRVATKDGSADNIIDNASCLNVQLPVTVIVNGQQVDVQSTTDLITIEDIFDEFDDDTDTLEIVFPITVVLADFSEVVVNDLAGLEALAANCPQENEVDLDIECIDFQYPITGSVLDTNGQVINTVTINNDNELYDFVENFDPATTVIIDFPITVILADGSTQVVNDLVELETVIEDNEDTCDEDDDNDYNDDDCIDCTTTQLMEALAGCNIWIIEDLERNGTDLQTNYVGYTFSFTADGMINVTSANGDFTGTWTASGSTTNITVTINITGLDDFNGDWILHEIDQDPQEPLEISLESGQDELSFESNC